MSVMLPQLNKSGDLGLTTRNNWLLEEGIEEAEVIGDQACGQQGEANC